MSMNETLAQLYGTNVTSEDQEKLAQVELFAKLAAEQGIDLSALPEEKVAELYLATFPEEAQKLAEEEKKDEEEKKKEKAAAYFAEKRAEQEKFAEADYMGRIMAHAFVHELNQIQKQAGELPPWLKDKKEEGDEEKKDEEKKEAHAPAGQKTAKAEAFDQLALEHAVKVAEAGGYDPKEAAQRVSAVYTLGLQESEKVASLQDANSALHVRALEYLEAAGYPVDWNQVFGS